jgi:Tol biopolymer transport system component/DNA-binding winged helix-turn-helix (wHTH) protein
VERLFLYKPLNLGGIPEFVLRQRLLYSVGHVPAAEPLPKLPIRFGVFEVDLEARELRKHGIKVKLQQQPFEVLLLLLQSPGLVVTRDTLQKRIWSTDTFVDFDRGLNKAINRIREALGDLAGTPRFIETLPRLGYRFIAPVGEGPSGPGRHGQPVSNQRLVRSSLLPPANTTFLPNHFALSPDGTRLAFIAVDQDGGQGLWVRDLSAAGAQRLNGADGARLPFWSPDSRRIGFFAGGRLNTIDIAAGAVRVLCDARAAMGGAWHSEDAIVFSASVTGPLYRVGVSGGTPVPITPVPGQSSQLHCWPVFLPGSDRFLYFVNRTGPGDVLCNGIHAGSLSSTEAHLVSSEIDGNVGVACGHIFFVNGGALKAQPFDPQSLHLVGQPFAIAQHEMEVWEKAWFHSGFSVSESGILVFQSSNDFAPELVWTDASGIEQGRIRQRGYRVPAISPDGRFVAVSSDELHNGMWRICVHDVERGVTTPLTDGRDDWHPSWSADGKRIIYAAQTDGHMQSVYDIAADGSGRSKALLELGLIAHSSPDGHLAYMRFDRGEVLIEVHSPCDGQTTLLGPGAEPQFSPDGKWIAFTAVGGGGIAVRPFPGPGPHIQVSRGPAAQARWSRDGTQIFYIAPDKKLVAVSFSAETGRAGAPRELFQTRIVATSLAGFQYDVAPDGRFLINSLPSGAAPLTLLTNWTAALKR